MKKWKETLGAYGSIGNSREEEKEFRRALLWRNKELRKVVSKIPFESVINVSGWDDEDGEGRKYISYFPTAKTYWVSNIEGQKGLSGSIDYKIRINLEEKIVGSHYRSWDLVFCHTTLEHIFHVETAFKNLCNLSKSMVVLVVPYSAPWHEVNADWGDYWRFTPLSIKRLFEANGFGITHISVSPGGIKYIFAVAGRSYVGRAD